MQVDRFTESRDTFSRMLWSRKVKSEYTTHFSPVTNIL